MTPIAILGLLVALATYAPTVPASTPATFRVTGPTVAVYNCDGYACRPSGFFLEGTEGQVGIIALVDGEYHVNLGANGLLGWARCELALEGSGGADYQIVSHQRVVAECGQ